MRLTFKLGLACAALVSAASAAQQIPIDSGSVIEIVAKL